MKKLIARCSLLKIEKPPGGLRRVFLGKIAYQRGSLRF
jgi:hypothetical protein